MLSIKRLERFTELSEYHFVDADKISEEEKYDGYYVIVTSELNANHDIRCIQKSMEDRRNL